MLDNCYALWGSIEEDYIDQLSLQNNTINKIVDYSGEHVTRIWCVIEGKIYKLLGIWKKKKHNLIVYGLAIINCGVFIVKSISKDNNAILYL